MAFGILTYGTLMDGRSRNYILRQLRFQYVRTVTVTGFKMRHFVDGNYPVMLKNNGGFSTARGEIWRFPNVDADTTSAIIGLLDNIEAEGTLYSRTKLYDSISGLDIFMYVGIPETWNSVSSSLVPIAVDNEGKWVGGDV